MKSYDDTKLAAIRRLDDLDRLDRPEFMLVTSAWGTNDDGECVLDAAIMTTDRRLVLHLVQLIAEVYPEVMGMVMMGDTEEREEEGDGE